MNEIPDYLSDIEPSRRDEIISTSAEMTRDIPGAIICGGNANRILYEAYTGKTMFGVGKNDSDIYVNHSDFKSILNVQPKNYELKHELDENGNEKWVRPDDGYIVLVHSGEHIDVFNSSDDHKFTEVELDGQKIRVQSLTDQINDKIRMMYETNGLADIEIDSVHNPDPASKYGVYAQKILEIADSEKGRAELSEHADELPDDWREILEVMASKGKYGKEIAPDKLERFQERLKDQQKLQNRIKQIQNQLINELESYFESNQDATLPSLMDGFDDKINEAFDESSNPKEFIQRILNKLSDSEKRDIKDRIKTAAGEEK